MKLGDVLRKERESKKLSLEDTASKLGLSEESYRQIEAGESPAETWGPLLANIAIKLETPTSRLLADSGKSADSKPGQAGELIRKHRERRTQDARADGREAGDLARASTRRSRTASSPIEEYGPLLLHFAEIIEQPVFNLFYPVRPAARQAERRGLPLGCRRSTARRRTAVRRLRPPRRRARCAHHRTPLSW